MKILNDTSQVINAFYTTPRPGSVIGPFDTLDLARAACTRLMYSTGICCHVGVNTDNKPCVFIDEDTSEVDNS